MICSAERLLAYLVDHNEIGLTKAKAFQRKFVHWAAANFEWPGFEEGNLYDHALGMLWSQVLRPLSWLGVLTEVQPEGMHGFEHRICMKTPLWNAAFDLYTDYMLQEPLRH